MKPGMLLSLTAMAVVAQAFAQEPPRTFLTKAEMEQTLGGRKHSFKHLASGSLIQWDLRQGGTLYYNNLTHASTGGNGSGKWEIREDGALCVQFSNIGRDGSGGCSYYFRDGDKLSRTGSSKQTVVAQIEKIN